MTFIDRVPMYPGRIKLVPVPGQENTFDMVRADEPLVEGTPVNKVLFDSLAHDIEALMHNVANLINSHASMNAIGGLPIGGEFGIYENGMLVPFIKVAGDYGGTGRSVVMRKHIYKKANLVEGTEYNVYKNCLTDRWLNNEYLGTLDALTRENIAAVPIICTVGGGAATTETIERKIFLPSAAEMGVVGGWLFSEVEGTQFAFFNSDERRIAQFNGEISAYWLRSAKVDSSTEMGVIELNGSPSTYYGASLKLGIRPVFTLPFDFEVNISIPNTTNVMANSEVI